jgi:hypothetical protein
MKAKKNAKAESKKIFGAISYKKNFTVAPSFKEEKIFSSNPS